MPRTRNVKCVKCDNNEAVYIQSLNPTTENIALFFVCCKCNNIWREGDSDI